MTDTGKDRMLRNKYKDDYQKNKAGLYSYTGRYYTLSMDQKRKQQTGRVNLGVSAAFFALEVAAGLINPDSSRTVWIVLPYFFLFLPMGFLASGALAYLRAPLRMERVAYEHSLVRLRRSCIAVMVLAGVNLLLDAVFLAMHASQIHIGREVLYLLCFAAMEALGIFYGKRYDRMYGGLRIDE
jgi:hypothetical protein